MLAVAAAALTIAAGPSVNPTRETSFQPLVEANFDLDGKNVPLVRAEYVQKLGHDLVPPGDPDAKYDVFQGSFGYMRRFTGGPVVPTVGISVDVGLVPGSIRAQYGARAPVGAFVFVGLQPPKLSTAHQHHLSRM
jgi:hypothetical protein